MSGDPYSYSYSTHAQGDLQLAPDDVDHDRPGQQQMQRQQQQHQQLLPVVGRDDQQLPPIYNLAGGMSDDDGSPFWWCVFQYRNSLRLRYVCSAFVIDDIALIL